jgi:hypothetical protein
MEINLPRHLINDVERRWAKKLEQAANERKNGQKSRVTIPRTATAGRCRGIRRRQSPGWSRTENVKIGCRTESGDKLW